MARNKKKTDLKGCLLLAMLVLGGFFLLNRLLFMASAPGVITSVSAVNHQDSGRYRDDVRIVRYTYSVGEKTYKGSCTVSEIYDVAATMPVTVKYWRFKRSVSTLSEWRLPRYKQYTFRAEMYRWAMEYFIFPTVAMVIAAVFGLPMRRKNKK